MNSHRLVGIDEAGLGPILGPLVIAAAGFCGPAGGDPYRLLARVLSRRAAKGKLRVADSKKVYAGRKAFHQLEKTALVFLSLHGGRVPATLEELLATARIEIPNIAGYPWYRDLGAPLPRSGDAKEIELLLHRLRRELEKSRIDLDLLAIRAVDVQEWNALLARTDNKSVAHFQCTAELIARAAGTDEETATHLVVDRCGARMRYARLLRDLFPKSEVSVLEEEKSCSVYEVGQAGACKITFLEKGEDHALPVALASCLAKYVRELLIERLNEWFRSRVPGVKPTAGAYYTDGRRFLEDVREVVEAPGFPTDLLVRNR